MDLLPTYAEDLADLGDADQVMSHGEIFAQLVTVVSSCVYLIGDSRSSITEEAPPGWVWAGW